MPMVKESYVDEVMRLAVRILASAEEGRQACAAECDAVVDCILAGQWHRDGFPRVSSMTRRSTDRQLRAATDVSAAHAMLVAVDVYVALNAEDPTAASPAHEFRAALERRAEVVR
jgi:hypothetical protein